MQLKYECQLRWEDLNGTSNRRRHCGDCNQYVFNLSGMTKKQAKKFLRTYRGDSLCVHFVDVDGHIVHQGDPLEQLHNQRVGAGKLLAAALILQNALLSVADDPFEFYLDPFAAAAAGIQSIADGVEDKYDDADTSVTMGVVF